MNRILAIDTSSEACSASLIIDNNCKTLFKIAPQGHSELILPMCSELLAEAQIRLSDLDGLAFSRGPGSFTGLRIGAGVVQGIAYAHDLPVMNISSLDALAYKASLEYQQSHILSVIDARMGEVYWAEYFSDNFHDLQNIKPESLSLPADIVLNTKKDYIGIGSGIEMLIKHYRDQALTVKIDDKFSNQLVSAEEIALLAANNKDKYKWVSAENVLPVYLRNNVVHQPKKKVIDSQ